jgi:hypothetical protein
VLRVDEIAPQRRLMAFVRHLVSGADNNSDVPIKSTDQLYR